MPQDQPGPRHLFVFYDGTRNDVGTNTNVLRMFDAVTAEGAAPNTRSLWIEGVGNSRTPLTGSLLGAGMEGRILTGYRFISSNFRRGDKIYIVGFSRGAHQARALAGMIAHVGLPGPGSKFTRRKANRLLELTKKESDRNNIDNGRWRERPTSEPFLGTQHSGMTMVRAEIEFLGVWDTVPGSSFKDYPLNACMEEDGTSKNDRKRDGERYKTGSYPPIKRIVQALAHDEKRHKFRPLLLCAPIDPSRTTIVEEWFPGAHSDVGGRRVPIGNSVAVLSNAPYNWMLRHLQSSYTFAKPPVLLAEDPYAIAQWSMVGTGAFASHCEDRNPMTVARGPAVLHESLIKRLANPSALLSIDGVARNFDYPFSCKTAEQLK